MVFPAEAEAMAMTRLSDLRAFYRVAPEVWAAVVSTLGDPAEDLRPFAAVPPAALAMACETADVQGAAMTAIQASQVGLTYRLARRICHVRAGGSWGLWEDPNPWESALTPTETSSGTPGTTRLEPKMKMTHVLDQADETEFMVEPEETRAKWVTQYVSLTGGLPPEEEEPSMEQLSALSRRVFSLKGAPYADFSVWVPYGKKALRTARFRSYVATLEGFVTKELAGPTNFEMWQASYRVYRTAMVMLNITPLAHLNAYETHIEKMVRFYPGCWHLIVQADDRARSEHLTRLKLRVTEPGFGSAQALQRRQPVADPLQGAHRRRQVLVRPGLHPGHCVVGPGRAGSTGLPSRTNGKTPFDPERGAVRWRLFITDHLRKGRGEVKEETERRGEAGPRKAGRAGAGWGLSLQGERQGCEGECQVLRLEQREWALRRSPTRQSVCGSNQARTQVYHLQLPWSPFPKLPLEEVRFGPHPQLSHEGIKGAPLVFLILGMARRFLRRTAGGHEGGSEGDAPANEPGESSKGPRKRKAPPQGWKETAPGGIVVLKGRRLTT